MESLVDLTICVNQVGIVHREHIIDGDVDIDASFAVLVFEQGNFNCGDVAKSPFFRDLLYDFSTVFD